MDFLKIIEITSTVLVMLSIPLISIPDVKGLYLLIFAQIGWSIFAYQTGHQFLLIQSLFLIIFNFIGIWNWKRKGIGVKEESEINKYDRWLNEAQQWFIALVIFGTVIGFVYCGLYNFFGIRL